MITYSIIQKSQLEGALRLDADFYEPYYFDLEKKIKNKKWDYLGNLIVFNRRGIQPKYTDTPTKCRAVVSQNILEDFLDVDNLPFVEKDFFNSKQAQAVKIKPFDILIYTTGANIGRTNIFYPKTIEAIASNHVNIIRADESKINQLYLGIFLQSKIGRDWTDRWASGSDQEEIYPEDFEKFPVLIADNDIQNEIANLVLQSFEFIESSNKLYSQAENLLLEELGLKDFKVEDDLFYIINLSKIKSAHRADAEYFQPKYERLISKIKYKMEKLNNLLLPKKGIKKGIEIGSEQYQEEGKLFIRVSNLSKHGLVERDQKYLSEALYQKLKKDFEPKVGEILLTKDATPGIAYLLKEPIEGIIAGGILRLRVKPDIDPEYLALVINSIAGQMQVEKDTGGSVIFHWRPDQIKNLLIPILPKPTQQKIADLVQKSHEARKKAKQLLEEAKRKVEETIEKN
jgi:restriction endonuclease S subunit